VRRLIIWASALCVSASVFAAEWPQFRGPNRDGISPETGINKEWATKAPKELWRINLGDNGYSGPAVADGKVFITDHQGAQDVVRAINIEDGKDVWTFKYDGAPQPIGGYGFTRPTMTIANGIVYNCASTGKVHALDAQNGKLIWKRDFADFKGKSPNWGYAASPLLHDGKLIVCPGGPNATLAALDPETGKTLWSAGADGAAYSTPVVGTINGVEQYVVFSQNGVGGYAADKGKKLWNHPWKTSYDVNASCPIILDNAVFISSGYNVGCAVLDITPAGAKVRWQNKAIQEQFTSGILVNGMIYSTTDPGDLVCVDPKTGKDAWRHGGFEKGGIVGVEGTIIGLNGNGGDLIMVELKPDAYSELGRIKPLAGQCWTAPIVAEGKVIARDLKTLVCLDLK
jgi:outer membrane protein assembly factor BamB